MATDHELLDAFADTRRTWDDLIGLQTDVVASSRRLTEKDLAELNRQVQAHRAAVDALADAIETQPTEQRSDTASTRSKAHA